MSAHPAAREHHTHGHVNALRGVSIHGGVYGVVSIFLLALNALTGGNWWIAWPLLGWGAAVTLHAYAVFAWEGLLGADWGACKMDEPMAAAQAAGKRRRPGLVRHRHRPAAVTRDFAEVRAMKTPRLLLAGILGLALAVLLIGRGLVAPSRAATSVPGGAWTCAAWRSGSGMMGAGPTGRGPGMMGGNAFGNAIGAMWGQMGGMGMMGFYPASATPITEADARQRLAAYAAGCGAGVHVGDVMAFGSNDYGQLVDAAGAGVGEILVDRYTGVVYPEPGPNMLWNTRSGMHLAVSGAARYDQAAAQQLAATFLAGYLPAAKVLEGTAFPGYFTFDSGRATAEGMLSVNAATGQIWVHTWHGPALGGS